MRWLTKLANEAADECCMNRHFDYDLFNDYTQPFKDKFWFQHTVQIQTGEGPAETKACVRDLDDSLRKALHDKHKLGQVKARLTVLSTMGQVATIQGQATQ